MTERLDYQKFSGKAVAGPINEELRERVTSFLERTKRNGKERRPTLAILSNNKLDGSSVFYVSKKIELGHQLGFGAEEHFVDSTARLEELIDYFNNEPHVDGTIVQLPLMNREDPTNVVNQIDEWMDVDGLRTEGSKFRSATAMAVLAMLDHYEVDYRNRVPIALVGHGKLVGKPLRLELLERGVDEDDIHVIDITTEDDEKRRILDRSLIVVSAVGKKVLDVTDFTDFTGRKIVIDAGTAASTTGGVEGDVTDELRYAAPRSWAISNRRDSVGTVTKSQLWKHLMIAAERKAA